MRFWVIGLVLLIIGTVFTLFTLEKEPIKVGLLYSKSGTMATSEIPVALMFKAAIQEINDNGGILSQKVEIIEYDAASDPQKFQIGAEQLIHNGVVAIFGGWTSSSRKEIKNVVEQYNNFLFYPLQYEGLEESANILYLGLSANQQINPTLDFIQTHFGKNIYLVGSGYIYPKAAHYYITELSKLTELNIVGEHYTPLATDSFGDLFGDIKEKKPDAIINTLNGDSNIAFFTQLKEHGISSEDIPVFSLSLDASIVSKITHSIAPDVMQGHYATWGYFDSLYKHSTNQFTSFVKNYCKDDIEITDAMFSLYLGVQIFKDAVIKGNSTSVESLQQNIKRGNVNLSGDIYFVDPLTNHLYRHVMVGKINSKNDFDIVWQSDQMIKAHPYPTFKSKKEWLDCVSGFSLESTCKNLFVGNHHE